jgi:hypothetical protein
MPQPTRLFGWAQEGALMSIKRLNLSVRPVTRLAYRARRPGLRRCLQGARPSRPAG